MILDEVLNEDNRSFDMDDMVDIFTEGFLFALEMQETGNRAQSIEELSMTIAEGADVAISELSDRLKYHAADVAKLNARLYKHKADIHRDIAMLHGDTAHKNKDIGNKQGYEHDKYHTINHSMISNEYNKKAEKYSKQGDRIRAKLKERENKNK